MAPAPFPFETDVEISAAGHEPLRLIGGVLTGGSITPIWQALDMTTGELTTVIDAKMSGSTGPAVRLKVLQFMSRQVPSLAVMRISASAPANVNITLQPNITTAGMPGAVYDSTTDKRNIFGEGVPYAFGLQTNSGSKLGISVGTVCNGAGKPSSAEEAAPCTSRVSSGSVSGQSTAVAEVTMESYAAFVSDLYHTEPVQAAVRMAHYGMYQSFEVLR
jgi:hypothetical protein